MQHADLQSALFQRWRVEATIDGQPVAIPGGLPVRSLSTLRGRGTCTLPVTVLPRTGAKAAAVDLILNDIHRVRFFTGVTAERSATYTTFSRSTTLTDILNLDRAVPAEITWNNRPWLDAVGDVLAAGGLGAVVTDFVFDPGATFAIGPSYPVVIPVTENLGSLLQELLDFAGGAIFVSPTGQIRIVDGSGIPASTSAVTYAHGANLAAGAFGIIDAGLTIEGNEALISVFTATGPKTPDGIKPDGTYTAAGVTGKPESKSYRFAQSDATCMAIAARELSRRARSRVNLWLTAPLNPLLLPAQTILFRCAALGYPTSVPAYVAEVTTTAEASMRVAIVTGPSLVDGYRTSIAPPVVDWAMTVESQSITLAGAPVTGYLVQCTDQSYDTAGYQITARAWTATGTGVSPASGTSDQLIFLFTDLTGATITLHVTSESGEEAEQTRTVTAAAPEVFTRTVAVAADDGWHVLTSLGWTSFTAAGTCTAVPPINESGPLWAGFSSGALYKTTDALATAPTLATTFSSGVGCLWVNERNTTDILAGHGTALSRSQDGGATWVVLHTFGASLTACQSSPASPGEIRVCAGATEQISYDGGATWTILITGATGATARSIASAPWGHAVGFEGVASVADAVRFEEGHTVIWTDVAEASRPASGLAGITPLITAQGYVAAETGMLVRDGTLPALILQADAGGANLYQLLWNGSAFVATLLPATTAAGPGKLINQTSAYPIDSTSATQIGYGSLAVPVPVVVATLYRLPSGASGAADKIWCYANGVWTGKTPPEAGRSDWINLVANPFNKAELLLWRWAGSVNRLWYSADSGATWTSVMQDVPCRSDIDPRGTAAAWSSTTSGTWIASRHEFSNWWWPNTTQGRLIRGNRATRTLPELDYIAVDRFTVSPGRDDEVIIQGVDGVFRWFTSANVLQAAPSGAMASALLDRLPLTRKVAAAAVAQMIAVQISQDYHSAAYTAITGTSGMSVGVLADGTLIIGGRSGTDTGVQEVANAWGTATVTTAAFSGLTTGHARTDRQTQTVAAVVLPTMQTGVRGADGTWSIVAAPPAATALVDWVEITA